MSKIQLTLETLSKRLDAQGLVEVQQEEGYLGKMEVIFNPPRQKRLCKSCRSLCQRITRSFFDCIMAEFFSTIRNTGGGFKLFTVDEILEHRAIPGYDYPENWFPIAYGYDECYLVVTDQVIGRGYLFVMYTDNYFEDDMFIGMTFEEWLEKIIIAQGAKFWEWGFRIPPSLDY